KDAASRQPGPFELELTVAGCHPGRTATRPTQHLGLATGGTADSNSQAGSCNTLRRIADCDRRRHLGNLADGSARDFPPRLARTQHRLAGCRTSRPLLAPGCWGAEWTGH